MLYLLIGLGLIGFLPMIVVLFKKRRSDNLVKNGVNTNAVVKELYGLRINMVNSVRIEYQVRETGQIISKTIAVAGIPYSVGDQLPIAYDPKKPQRMLVVLQKKGFIPILIFTIIIAGFILFACYKLYEMA